MNLTQINHFKASFITVQQRYECSVTFSQMLQESACHCRQDIASKFCFAAFMFKP
jgi:hypothetical protein